MRLNDEGATGNPLQDPPEKPSHVTLLESTPPLWARELLDAKKSSDRATQDELVKQQKMLAALTLILFCTTTIFAVLYGMEKDKVVDKTYTNTMCSNPCGESLFTQWQRMALH